MYEELLQPIKNALEHNSLCSTPPPFSFYPIYVSEGFSDGQEILAPIFLNKSKGYWYGYIQKATKGLTGYFSVLVWLTKPVIGKTDNERLESFHTLSWKEGLFEPPTIQKENDAFVHTSDLNNAVAALVHIIDQFDIEKRFPSEDSKFYPDPVDCSILIYLGDIEKLILL